VNKIRWSDDRDGFFVMERDGSELYVQTDEALAYAAVCIADAAERIAAALGDQHQDDEYEYLSVGLVAAHDAFQDGWRLWRVIGGELFMRRPRKQE